MCRTRGHAVIFGAFGVLALVVGSLLILGGAISPSAPGSGSTNGNSALSLMFGRPETMSYGTKHRIERNLPAGYRLQLNFPGAQRLHVSHRTTLWLVEGRHFACVFLEHQPLPPFSCTPRKRARQEGIAVEIYKTSRRHPGQPTEFLAYGVTPFGVKALSVTIDGAPQTIPAPNNVWSAHAVGPIQIRRKAGLK